MDSGTKKAIVIALIVGVFAVVATALVYQGEVNTLQAEKQALQEEAAAAPTTGVDLEYDTESFTWNMSANVTSDGGSDDATNTSSITITNDGDRTANFVISAQDTVNDEDGFPSALENSYTSVYVTNDYKKYLLDTGDYTDGRTVSLPTDSSITLTLGMEIDEAPDGTFSDNQTYSSNLYVIQEDAQDVDELDISVIT